MVVVDLDDFAERHLCAVAAGDQHFAELLRVLAEVARIADAHREALAAFDGGGEVLAADRGFDRVFYVGDVQAVAICGGAVDGHFEIGRAGGALGVEIGRAGNLSYDLLDLLRLLLRSRAGRGRRP